MPPRCRSCSEGANYDQPLFECIVCKKYYHSKCHRPHPQEKSRNTWTCQRCLMRSKNKEKKRYNDSASVSSHATSRALSSVLSSRRSSPAMSTASYSISSFTTESGESDPPKLITCGYPGCIEKTLSSQFLCHAHQLEAGWPAPTEPEFSIPPQVLRTSSANENISVDAGRSLPTGTKPNKILSENDKDRPILRRKTVSRDPPLARQSSSSRQATISVSDNSTVSPTSPEQIMARPPACSPPASSDSSPDSEPIRKRQKTSHSSSGFPEPRQNGIQTTGLDRADFGVKHKLAKVQPHRPSYASTQQRPGRGPEMEKNGFRLSSQNRPSPVRKMAPQNFRLIPGLGSVPVSDEAQTSRVEFAQSTAPPVNGFGLHGGNPSHQNAQNSAFRHNKDSHNFMGKLNQPPVSHNPNRTTTLNGHAEQRLANNEPNGQFSSDLQLPFNQMGPNFHTERTEIRMPRSQSLVVAKSRTQKPHSQHSIAAGMIAPITRQTYHVQPSMTVPAKVIDEAIFDRMIYQQEGASTPPPEVLVRESETTTLDPDPPDEPIYADVDPRIHWTLPQSDTWVENKLEEIEARGGRKANFGRAAISLKKRLEEQPLTLEETLPEKILDNPAWVRALKKLESDATEASASQGVNGAIKRKPGPKRQLSNGPGSGSVRGNAAELQTAPRVGLKEARKRRATEKSKLFWESISLGRNRAAMKGGTKYMPFHKRPKAKALTARKQKTASKRKVSGK